MTITRSYLWSHVKHLVVLPGPIQGELPGHGDVGELLLKAQDVAAHLLDPVLVETANVGGPRGHDVGNQRAKAFKNILQTKDNKNIFLQFHH